MLQLLLKHLKQTQVDRFRLPSRFLTAPIVDLRFSAHAAPSRCSRSLMMDRDRRLGLGGVGGRLGGIQEQTKLAWLREFTCDRRTAFRKANQWYYLESGLQSGRAQSTIIQWILCLNWKRFAAILSVNLLIQFKLVALSWFNHSWIVLVCPLQSRRAQFQYCQRGWEGELVFPLHRHFLHHPDHADQVQVIIWLSHQ